MSSPTNHWKLGLFVVCATVAFAGAVIFVGSRTLTRVTVPYEAFFDESVEGLEVGSPVKFRGVSIGNVSEIALADDKRHVQVTFALAVKVLDALGLAAERAQGRKTKLAIPPGLRVQLVPSGITGVKFMQLDFFDEQTNPPLQLPFEVPENTIPATPSTMKNLEATVVSAVDRFPELARQVLVIATQINDFLKQIQDKDLAGKIVQTLALVNRVLDQLNAALLALDPGALSRDAQAALKGLSSAMTSANQVFAQVGGQNGLVASVQRTSDAVGSTAQNAVHVGPDVGEALKDVQRAANSVQRLAEALEMDPDMLLKGRARRGSK
jgi:paraquat-inducible protein B